MNLPQPWRTPLLLTAAVVGPVLLFVSAVSLGDFIRHNQTVMDQLGLTISRAVAVLAAAVIIAMAVAAYVTPSIIAHFRGHPNKAAIIALNLIAGWTFIGWTIAFVWSLTHQARSPVTPRVTRRVTL